MSSNSDDIQAVSSDTRPPMLDRTNYESWSQRIRLYYKGRNDSFVDVQCNQHCSSGLPKDFYKLINTTLIAKAIWGECQNASRGYELNKRRQRIQFYDEFDASRCSSENIKNQNQRNFTRGNGAAGFGGTQNRAGNANAGQGKPIKCYNCNGIGHIARNCTQPKRPQNSDYFKDKMLLMQAQENGAVLDEEELLFLVGEQPNTFDADVDNQPVRDLARNEDNIFQADECDAFDSDVDDEPTAQSIFMANLSSAGPTNLQASSSDASILSEVPDLENANVASNNDQVEHEIHSEVQQSTVIDSNNADMGNSNVIPYEQYLTTNDVSVVPSCASFAPNTAYVLIDNNVHTPNEPLVTELAIYKEQVAIYEQRAKFELTE
ncbi:retrovirus-related pol polyprotein from transposon TNT 1-94 [Tanacetum coccineum]|uniref:Retrovirus-related pol polyprotein from transposon TNT 1-94 n=1 Tax=Tanacetum coccineum TaxID=301880 RepID=A0ABQ5F0W2_9ASTR